MTKRSANVESENGANIRPSCLNLFKHKTVLKRDSKKIGWEGSMAQNVGADGVQTRTNAKATEGSALFKVPEHVPAEFSRASGSVVDFENLTPVKQSSPACE